MSKFVGIRIYDITLEEIYGMKPCNHIEFVFESGLLKDFVKRNIIADEGTCDSRANDGKLVVRPQTFFDFRDCLKRVVFSPKTNDIKISTMKPITPEAYPPKMKKNQKYFETPYDGTIYDVVRYAKGTYYFGYTSKDMFEEECIKIIENKYEKSQKATEPGQE